MNHAACELKTKSPNIIRLSIFAAELGDYSPSRHSPGYVSEFRFHSAQTEEVEQAVEVELKSEELKLNLSDLKAQSPLC